MIKKNNGKIELDKPAAANFLLQLTVTVAAILIFYFNTIGSMQTTLAVQQTQINDLRGLAGEIYNLRKSVDSLIIVMQNK